MHDIKDSIKTGLYTAEAADLLNFIFTFAVYECYSRNSWTASDTLHSMKVEQAPNGEVLININTSNFADTYRSRFRLPSIRNMQDAANKLGQIVKTAFLVNRFTFRPGYDAFNTIKISYVGKTDDDKVFPKASYWYDNRWKRYGLDPDKMRGVMETLTWGQINAVQSMLRHGARGKSYYSKFIEPFRGEARDPVQTEMITMLCANLKELDAKHKNDLRESDDEYQRICNKAHDDREERNKNIEDEYRTKRAELVEMIESTTKSSLVL